MRDVQLHDKTFKTLISEGALSEKISLVAKKINIDYKGKCPIVIVVLNGAFMFASDLVKLCTFDMKLVFTKLSSYHGTESSGEIKEIIGIDLNLLTGEDIILIEDIVDTGGTISYLHNQVSKANPKSISVATLLYKPDAYKKDIKIDYIVESIANKFVVGYGLDYDELGRNLSDIYVLKD